MFPPTGGLGEIGVDCIIQISVFSSSRALKMVKKCANWLPYFFGTDKRDTEKYLAKFGKHLLIP